MIVQLELFVLLEEQLQAIAMQLIRNFKGNPKRFESWSLSYHGVGFLLTPLITCLLTERTGMFCVPKHQQNKETDTKDN